MRLTMGQLIIDFCTDEGRRSNDLANQAGRVLRKVFGFFEVYIYVYFSRYRTLIIEAYKGIIIYERGEYYLESLPQDLEDVTT